MILSALKISSCDTVVNNPVPKTKIEATRKSTEKVFLRPSLKRKILIRKAIEIGICLISSKLISLLKNSKS
tara:strand:+ start:67 stop:279 length:213 start_codon:yes stop_codon:yes gene_type:complete